MATLSHLDSTGEREVEEADIKGRQIRVIPAWRFLLDLT